LHCNSALADSPQVPYAIWSSAFVARHDRASGGLIGAAWHSNVFSELVV
jgi:hypothetical protein